MEREQAQRQLAGGRDVVDSVQRVEPARKRDDDHGHDADGCNEQLNALPEEDSKTVPILGTHDNADERAHRALNPVDYHVSRAEAEHAYALDHAAFGTKYHDDNLHDEVVLQGNHESVHRFGHAARDQVLVRGSVCFDATCFVDVGRLGEDDDGYGATKHDRTRRSQARAHHAHVERTDEQQVEPKIDDSLHDGERHEPAHLARGL